MLFFVVQRVLAVFIESKKFDLNKEAGLHRFTPLQAAATYSRACTQLLLDSGAAMDHRALASCSRDSIRDPNTSVFRLLLERGADPKARDPTTGRTPLMHWSPSAFDAIDTYKELVRLSDVNAVDNAGSTALHIVVAGECVLTGIQALLAAGARVDVKNQKGQTPFDLVEALHNKFKNWGGPIKIKYQAAYDCLKEAAAKLQSPATNSAASAASPLKKFPHH
jgi:hypothetical protein